MNARPPISAHFPASSLGPAAGEFPATLVEMLRLRAAEQAEKTLYTFQAGSRGRETSISYAGLDVRARSIAAALEEVTVSGDRALLLFPPGLEFLEAFFGCLYAGVAAVPTYPPNLSRADRALAKLESILASAAPAALLTTRGMQPGLEAWLAEHPRGASIRLLAVEDLTAPPPAEVRGDSVDETALALIQFTSGSTASPKGVMLRHRELMHNLALIRQAFGAHRESTGVFWLPFYHDMGLIGGVLQTAYCGGSSLYMPPVSFIQQPFRWLEAISRTRAAISGGPNFAYEECVRRIDEDQLAQLDLSCWNLAFCGAEPIHRETLDAFAEKFAPCGFRREALYACYGLAEATLMVTGGFYAAGAENSRVGSGRAIGDVQVKIVDPETLQECAEGETGEIWVASQSAGRGYWQLPEESADTFAAYTAAGAGPFLRTGDLGYLLENELFIAGRLKDMLILGGANHYPQDIERTVVESHPLLTGAAAFSVEVERTEQLVVVVEVSRKIHRSGEGDSEQDAHAVLGEIGSAVLREVARRHEIEVHQLVPVAMRTIPRTSSGKIQRRATREAFLTDALQRLELSK